MTDLHAVVAKAIPSIEHDDHERAEAVLSVLAAPANRDALAAWLVEAGMLVQPTTPKGRRLVGSMASDGEVGNVTWRPADMAEMYVPLYRFNREGGRA